MAKTRGDRLREARAKLFRSARAAAKALDMPAATYGAHERAELPGGRDYGPDEAARYARRFKVAPEWLLTGRDVGKASVADGHIPSEEILESPPEKKGVRVVGYVGAGAEAHYYAVSQGHLDEVPAPEGTTESTVAVEIRGDSLGPLFDHWLVFYDDVRSPVTTDLIGRLCVVGLPDDRILVKTIRRNRRGLYDLMSNFEDPIRDQEISWAAKVKNMVPR
jgi:hypothetical protein